MAGQRSFALFLPIFLISAGMAGCFSDPPGQSARLRTFEASYLVNEESVVDFSSKGEKATVVRADGSTTSALAMYRQVPGDPKDIDIYWLDKDLRIIVQEELCDRVGKDERCQTASLKWKAAGLSPYLPIDLVESHVDSDVAFKTPAGDVIVPVRGTDAAKTESLLFDLSNLEPGFRNHIPVRIDVHPTATVPQRFVIDAMVPYRFDVELQDLAEGELFSLPASVAAIAEEPIAYVGQGAYFPGERDDELIGLGHSFIELYHGFLGSESTAEKVAENGCLRRMAIRPADNEPMIAAGLLFEKMIAELDVVFSTEDETIQSWRVRVFEEPSGLRYESSPSNEPYLETTGCPSGTRHWPAVHASEFLRDAREWVGDDSMFSSFRYEDEPGNMPIGAEPSRSRYHATYRPAWVGEACAGSSCTVSYKALRASLDADRGLWLDVIRAADGKSHFGGK